MSFWKQQARGWAISELHDKSARFFQMAGSLVSLSRFDYLLCSPAFFQGVFGLEAALKLHYDADGTCLGELLSRAVREGVFRDALLKNKVVFSKDLKTMIRGKEKPAQIIEGRSHAELLSLLIPKLRNQFVHETYLLCPEFLSLTIHLREMADAITTKKTLPIR
ncbi:MAG: hypothetical protein ACXW32_06960 [Limisphaerales bacterium]